LRAKIIKFVTLLYNIITFHYFITILLFIILSKQALLYKPRGRRYVDRPRKRQTADVGTGESPIPPEVMMMIILEKGSNEEIFLLFFKISCMHKTS
jgi:hypothetical protein